MSPVCLSTSCPHNTFTSQSLLPLLSVKPHLASDQPPTRLDKSPTQRILTPDHRRQPWLVGGTLDGKWPQPSALSNPLPILIRLLLFSLTASALLTCRSLSVRHKQAMTDNPVFFFFVLYFNLKKVVYLLPSLLPITLCILVLRPSYYPTYRHISDCGEGVRTETRLMVRYYKQLLSCWPRALILGARRQFDPLYEPYD